VAAVPLGEYFATFATAVFLPLEVRELAKCVTLTRAGAFTINIAAVMYLLLAKYLFGLRGGRKAYDRERRGEQLSEVERIALGSDPRAGSGAPPEGSTADRDHALAGPDHGVDAKRPVRGSTRLFPRRSRVSSARSPVRS